MTALLVDALAAFRITRLITTDTITARLRGRVVRWAYRHRNADAIATLAGIGADHGTIEVWPMLPAIDGAKAPRLAYLVSCSWCTGLWVALLVTGARRGAPRVWAPVADAMATATAVGLLAERN